MTGRHRHRVSKQGKEWVVYPSVSPCLCGELVFGLFKIGTRGQKLLMRLPLLFAALTTVVLADAPKFEPIFNGRDLTGWHATDRDKFWRMEDGVLIGESTGQLKENYLWTDREYGDFVLEFDVRWTGEIDSGVEMRKPDLQLQLGVSRSLKRDMTGSFYVDSKIKYPEAGQAKIAAQLMHPEGQWNTFRLEAKGADFTVWINGQPASHYTDGKFSGAAPLGLQIHGGLKMKVEYRNLRIAVPN